MEQYFGTDGVRGVANQELSPELAFRLGRCGGHVLNHHAKEETPRVLVAKDTRISGDMLESALIAGLLSVGIDVMRLGVIPTPAVAYLTRSLNLTAGIMISASHNPVDDNGIKFFGNDGFKLSDDQEAEIETLLNSEDTLPRPSSKGLGRVEYFPEGLIKYINFLESTVNTDLSDVKVCIDAANGAAAPLVNQLFANLEADFITMGDRPNGLNINDGVGSTHLEALQAMVLENEGYCGIAFDGDGDRVLAVDEEGHIVDGDKIMYICGKHLKEKGQLKNNTIVSTVMSNIGFYHAVEAAEMNSVKASVGDRYVVQMMREQDLNFGGEQSGHIVFLDHNTTGDGLLTALQLLSVMKQSGKTLKELSDEVTIYPQKLVNIRVKDKHTVLEEEAVQEVIAEVESDMGEEGRILVRPSGTEPLLRVMAEAKTQEKCDEFVEKIANVIRELRGI